MTSPFANLLLKLQARLTANAPAIRFIDQDWNQLQQANPPVSWPCALIDFSETDFTQMQGYQDGKVNVTIRLATSTFTSTSSIVALDIREDAVEFYETEQALYEALQAWDADGLLVNDLVRISAATEKREDGLRVRVIVFECTFCDASVTG